MASAFPIPQLHSFKSLEQPGTWLNYRNGGLRNTCQQVSPPNKMTLTPPARSPLRTPPTAFAAQALPPAMQPPGTVAVFLSAQSDTQQLLHALMSTYNVREVVLVGAEGEELKLAKMHCYTVAGRLRQDVLVQTAVVAGLADRDGLDGALKALQGKSLRGVVCCLPDDVLARDVDLLDLDEAEVKRLWKSSVLALHAIARQTFPLLNTFPAQVKTNDTWTNGVNGYTSCCSPFFLLDRAGSAHDSPSAAQGAQDAMLQGLSRSRAAQGVTVGYAADVLPPPAPPSRSSFSGALDMPRYDSGAITPDAITPGYDDSPTKLWNLWAMQNDLESEEYVYDD